MNEFIQDGPILENQFESDKLLKTFLHAKIPSEILLDIEIDLVNFGEKVITKIQEMGDDAILTEPQLIRYDVWGNRIDKIKVAQGWKDLKDLSASEGLIALGYDRKQNEFSRLYQFAKLYLFNPSFGPAPIHNIPLLSSRRQ